VGLKFGRITECLFGFFIFLPFFMQDKFLGMWILSKNRVNCRYVIKKNNINFYFLKKFILVISITRIARKCLTK